MIAKFALPISPALNVSRKRLDWQGDAYLTRLFQPLPWTHFIELIRIDDPLKRSFY